MKLSEALQDCTLALLRRIAANHGIPAGDDVLRGELATAIEDRVSETAYLASITGSLPDEERSVLRYLSAHEWQGKAFLLERQFAIRRSGAPTVSPCLSLLQKGLLFRTFGVVDSWRGELYYVPEDLQADFAAMFGREGDVRGADIDASVPPPDIARWRDPAYDLFCLLSHLRRSERNAHGGHLSTHDIRQLDLESPYAVSARETGDSAKRWQFLLKLCMGAGWAWRDGGRLRPGRKVAELLSGTRAEIRQRLLDRYLKDRSLSDLADTGKLKQPLGSTRRIDECAARQMLMHHLVEIAGSRWSSLEHLAASLQAVNPDFLREDYASLGSAVLDANSDIELQGPTSWQLVEGEWIRYVLMGPLYWIGAVTWGKVAAEGYIAFRLSQPEDAPAAGELDFKEDFTVVASRAGELGLLYRLEPYMALRASDDQGRHYRLTASSVRNGLQAGGSIEELRGLLRMASAVPEKVAEQVMDWAASYGRLVIESPVLLTAASEDDLLDISRIPGVAACLGDPIGSVGRRVLPHRFWQLLTALREAGQPPVIDQSVGSTRARSVTGDPSMVKEYLFAMLALRSLFGSVDLEAGDFALRALEMVLGPEATQEVSKRAQEVARKLRSSGDGTW